MRAENQRFDAVIIGGGPAGASCAVWLARLGFSAIVLEAAQQIGGLCRLNPFSDEWNVSLPGMTGAQVADNLARSLDEAGVPVRLSYSVAHVQPGVDGFTVTAKEPEPIVQGRYLVLATGVTARTLERQSGAMPGLLVGPGEHIVAQDFQGKRVAVLGGGDNAFENALYAMTHGASCVRIYARTIRAQQQFVRQVPAGTIVQGDYYVDAQGQTVNAQSYDLIMVFYGWEPSIRFADTLALQRNGQGFIATNAGTAETSCPGVYAIGEVAQRQHPCVVTAMADGVAAAKAIQARIERSASWPASEPLHGY